MKILIVGGVAAGTKAAAKLKRIDRSAEVKIITKSQDISYAGCGLPYYVGGLIETRDELIVNTPASYSGLTGAEVVTGSTVTAVHPTEKTVTVQDAVSGKTYDEHYDKLIIATGAAPFVPPMEGTELSGVFKMRTPDDSIGLREYITSNSCRKAVVAGGGFIGLEIAENLLAQGLSVTVIDFAPQIMPNIFDREMADYAKNRLQNAGIKVRTDLRLLAISGDTSTTGVVTDAGPISADVVVLSIGVRPATAFLADSGIDMVKGTIVVNDKMETNIPDIYAAGDCAMVYNLVTKKPQWSAMGSTANITARCLAKTICGQTEPYGGCLGTGVVKLLPDLNAGRTGLTETQARDAGYSPVSVICVLDDKAHYYPDASSFIVKLIADNVSHKLLGIQVLGAGAVDKMVDIAVTGIGMNAKIEDFDTLDFAYAPPFSTAIHPFVQACYILENKLSGAFETFTPAEYTAGAAKGYTVIDAHPQPKIPGAQWVDLTQVDGPIKGLDKDTPLLLVCAKGKRGYFLQNRLKYYGYVNTKVLEGGMTFNKVRVEGVKCTISPEEIKRVKGLGCLWDKRYPDIFNVRVITRNGKLTTDEQTAVATAADKFGSGEVTMTSRLTLEIQGVPYDKIDDVIEFLHNAGLETGGTGSKVRPVVSCKGTTCQYGLYDTFALSAAIHEKFYKGYHDVTLPHKFKIAVGGCPNNCVKPDLNDLGIIGQRIPEVDLEKCKGCKVCQIEKACPINVAKLADGKINIDVNACNHCGRCIGKCPFHAIEGYTSGYKVCIGGRWGKKVAQGIALDRILTSEEEVMATIEKAILLFRNEGIPGERFADTIQRLGIDYVQKKLYSNELLENKTEYLEKKVKGGATC
jgi:NADPH-dependent 2,4-dienoyl-CoA reductase/sulfur reductase-like enzyme/dissimilatory sulfite reductase (desulfoviridin) alpha/beta subunit/rhodanese-related sulfurtransferase